MTSHILCASEELRDGEARRFDVDGHRIAVGTDRRFIPRCWRPL